MEAVFTSGRHCFVPNTTAPHPLSPAAQLSPQEHRSESERACVCTQFNTVDGSLDRVDLAETNTKKLAASAKQGFAAG